MDIVLYATLLADALPGKTKAGGGGGTGKTWGVGK